jgi:hypothetical protein
MLTPIKLFISYAEEDRNDMINIKQAIAPLECYENITIWTDEELRPTREYNSYYDKIIMSNLRQSSIVICLISDKYLDKEFCKKEMNIAVERHNQKKCTVIPITLNSLYNNYEYKHLQIFKFTAGTIKNNPISEYADKNIAYNEIYKFIKQLAYEYFNRIASMDNEILFESALLSYHFGLYDESEYFLKTILQKNKDHSLAEQFLKLLTYADLDKYEQIHFSRTEIAESLKTIREQSKLFQGYQQANSYALTDKNQAICIYHDIIKQYPICFFMYHNLIELYLTLNNGFDVNDNTIKSLFKYFPDDKNVHITYDLLNIFNSIINTKSCNHEELFKDWRDKYIPSRDNFNYKKYASLGKWKFYDIYAWLNSKHKNNKKIKYIAVNLLNSKSDIINNDCEDHQKKLNEFCILNKKYYDLNKS